MHSVHHANESTGALNHGRLDSQAFEGLPGRLCDSCITAMWEASGHLAFEIALKTLVEEC